MYPETPILISCLVGFVGVLGFVAAMVAASGVKNEREILEKGILRLRDNVPDVIGGQTGVSEWFAAAGLPVDSHFGDCLKSVWGGWRAGRIPRLAELHTLSVRRERRRLPARFAAGVIGLLVVSGIAGTLFCIHPILDEFKIAPNSDGTVDAAKGAESASKMIKDLGSAFYPSLTALIATVVVATCFGGHYSRGASSLAWELDRLAIDELFPMFRLRTLGDELSAVGNKLSALIEGMNRRDEQFGELVKRLLAASSDLIAAGPSWIGAAKAVSKSAEGLTVETRAMLKGLATHLGVESPVVLAMASIEPLARDSNKAAGHFRQASETLLTAIDQLGHAVSAIPSGIEQGCAVGSRELLETSRLAGSRAAVAIAKAGEAEAERLKQTIASGRPIWRNPFTARHESEKSSLTAMEREARSASGGDAATIQREQTATERRPEAVATLTNIQLPLTPAEPEPTSEPEPNKTWFQSALEFVRGEK
jgi:hypothetical protein